MAAAKDMLPVAPEPAVVWILEGVASGPCAAPERGVAIELDCRLSSEHKENVPAKKDKDSDANR